MAAPPPPPPPLRSLSALPDEITEEILARLPHGDPPSLLRSSIVCKAWRCAVSRRSFRRRLHELHGTPPVLGVLHNWEYGDTPRFISTIPSSFSLAAPDRRSWKVIDCRHGRALFFSDHEDTLDLLLWEPITGAQQIIPVTGPAAAAFGTDSPTAAVLCAADGCDHRDCLGGPFRVVLVFSVDENPEVEEYVLYACVYSSETGAWGELTSMHGEFAQDFISWAIYHSNALVGTSLLYFMSAYGLILEYDLARHSLKEINAPFKDCIQPMPEIYNLMLTEEGELGVSEALGLNLKLWTREADDDDADAPWVLSRDILLQNLLPDEALVITPLSPMVLGFAEDANVIFLRTYAGVFAIELQSQNARKVCNDPGFSRLIPVVTFYTPKPRGEHQNLLVAVPNEKESGGEEEKTVHPTHNQPFDKESNASKEGDFVNTFECASHDLKIRVPCHGEGALEGASELSKHGCVLLPKDSSGDVPKSSPNEELVKGTTSIDDDGNSMTIDRNVVDAPSSEKDLKWTISKQRQEEAWKCERKEKN